MADGQPFFSFKETRLSLEPSIAKSTIAIRLPAHGAADQSARTPQRRLQVADVPATDDEAAFARKNLASASSIYFRKSKKRHPRSFLWRVLEEGKVLAIQSVDLSRSLEKDHEPALTLRLTFSSSIRPAGVAFADAEDREPLVVFVLTTSNDLYTLTLRPEFFNKTSATEKSVDDWCKIYLSTSFSFRYPHQIVAHSPLALLISLHDGGLLRLTRKPEDDGSSWTETFYNEGGWGSSFRSLIPWQGHHTVRYGNANLNLSTATSLVVAPASAHDGQDHVFTVSINHMIKGWNMSSGKTCVSKDLLDQERQSHDLAKYSIDPSSTNLIKVVVQKLRGDRDLYYLVTYSPLGSGQFKFWAVQEGLQSELELQDLFPEQRFEPPPPSSEIWSMAQFEVVPTPEPGILVMQILWKNNTIYRLHRLDFELMRVAEDWLKPWSATATEMLREEPLPSSSSAEPEDPTDRWLEYIFYPGRFTDATLATSLSIYEQNLNVPKNSSSKKNKNIKELVCLSVGSAVSLGRSSEGGMDYQRFRLDTDSQWRRFYRIVAEIDKQRGEATSLAIDEQSDLAWIVTVDGVSAVRECNETEILYHNSSALTKTTNTATCIRPESSLAQYQPDGISRMARLVQAAADFRECLSNDLLHSCQTMLDTEIMQEPSLTVPARISNFYDRSNFAAHVSDDDYEQILAAFDPIGGLRAIDTSLFEAVVGTIAQEKQITNSDVTLTVFGERTIVKGAQELIHHNSSILFNLLMLVVFLVKEDDPDDPQLTELDSSLVFVELTHLLKEYSVLKWLGKTACLESPSEEGEELGKARQTDRSTSTAQGKRVSSLLQYPWVRNWNPQWRQPRRSMALLMTQSIKHVLADIGLSQSGDYSQQVMWLQRTLIRRGRLDLAGQFLKYQPSTAWSVYFKARFYLATKDYTTAASHFKKAAYNLAHQEGALLAVNGTDDILDATDGEFFNAGLPKYYSHIVSLFEKEGAFSFVVDFARVGLHFSTTHTRDESTKPVRTELLNRLFTASLQTCCFDTAYSALLQFSNKALQRAALNHLVTTLCSSPNPHFHAALLRLPFLDLQQDVDALLAQKCRTTLTLQSSPPYHKILYAWRLQRGDYRGAAEVLHERLQLMKLARDSREGMGARARTYLALINTLAVVGETETWILAGGDEGGGGVGFGPAPAKSMISSTGSAGKATMAAAAPKRRIVHLDDIRKEYQAELDRAAMIENDRYAFAAVMDDDGIDGGDVFGMGARSSVMENTKGGFGGFAGRQDLVMADAGQGRAGDEEADGMIL